MQKLLVSFVAVVVLACGTVSAAIIEIDFSPAPGDALNSTNYANGDHTLGISAPNSVAQAASSGTGGEIGAGVTYDTDTNVLSFDIGYGSDFGFVDMVGDFTVAHIHGPAAVQFPATNTGAGVVVGLPHTAGSSGKTGSFTGSVVLSALAETQLLDNLLYINIHSSFVGGGEIRGQFVPVPEPTAALLAVVVGACCLSLRRTRRRV